MQLRQVVFLLILFFLSAFHCLAKETTSFQEDTLKLSKIKGLVWDQLLSRNDSAIINIIEMRRLAEKLSLEKSIARSYNFQSVYYYNQGRLEEGIQASLKARELSIASNDFGTLTSVMFNLANGLSEAGCIDRSIELYKECKERFEAENETIGVELSLYCVASSYQIMEKSDSLKAYADKLVAFQQGNGVKNYTSEFLYGHLHGIRGEYEKAIDFVLKGVDTYNREREVKPYADLIAVAIWYAELGLAEKAKTILKDLERQPEYDEYLKTGSFDRIYVMLAKLEGQDDLAIRLLKKKATALDNTLDSTDFAAIDRALNLMSQSSNAHKLKQSKSAIAEVRESHSENTKLFWMISIALAILIFGIGISQRLLARNNLKLEALVQQLRLQDKSIAESIVYGQKMQQALFSKSSAKVEQSESLLNITNNESGAEGMLSWTTQNNPQYITCFFHPINDEVTNAFGAIICHEAFQKVAQDYLNGPKHEVDILTIYNDVLHLMEERLSTAAQKVEFSLMHCHAKTRMITAFDGEELKLSKADLSEDLELKNMAIEIASGKVSVFCDETTRLLQHFQDELFPSSSLNSRESEKIPAVTKESKKAMVKKTAYSDKRLALEMLFRSKDIDHSA